MSRQEKANEIEDRLIEFAVRVMNVAEQLPKNPTGNHVANQILKSGTSPAPNYGEARGAESMNDFAHKLGIVLKELNETSIWLKIIKKKAFFEEDLLRPLLEENKELCKIINASIQTVRHQKKKSVPLSKQGPRLEK